MIKKHNKNYNTRKKTTTQRLALVIKILSVLIIIAFVVWAAAKTKGAEFLKTKVEWQIDDNLPIAKAILAKKIKPLIENKYQLNLTKIKQALESQPWIAKVHIKRLFFNTIQINIESRQIAMRWKNTNCKTKNTPNCFGYISNNGILFIPKKKVKSDAVLARSKVDKVIIAQLYQDYQNYLKISEKMRIKSFSKTHIDKLVFKPSIKVVLGYQQKHQRLKRFLKAYKELRKTISKTKLNRATFDMRYPKAFALKL